MKSLRTAIIYSVLSGGVLLLAGSVSAMHPAQSDCYCTEVYQPVCADNGQTYSNQCKAFCAGVHVQHPGECRAYSPQPTYTPPSPRPWPSPAQDCPYWYRRTYVCTQSYPPNCREVCYPPNNITPSIPPPAMPPWHSTWTPNFSWISSFWQTITPRSWI